MDLPVDTAMRSWPDTTRAFLAFGMGCIGRPIGSFHTIGEACREHDADLGAFLTALSDAASAKPSPHFEEDSAIK